MTGASNLSIITLVIGLACDVVGAVAEKTPQNVDLSNFNGWNIVVADDAIPSEIYAAEEFREFFRQASGLKLPIVHKIMRWDKHVFIGPGKVMRASPAGFSVEDLGPEDLRIVVRDDNIAIAGGRPRGTLYGVYTFLEDYMGVRFLTQDHTHVPPVGQRRIIGPIDRVYRPPFSNYRCPVFQTTRKHPVFSVRNRNNGNHHAPQFGGISPFININHSLGRQAPFTKYGKDYPEYFCLWDGKRGKGHYCLTNPDMVPIVTEAVLKEIQLPDCVGRKNFAVSQDDTVWQYCQCDDCIGIDEREESHMGALLRFVNAVADEVAKTHPDVDIGTLAYGFSRKPPKTIKCRPNVAVNLTTWGRCHVHLLTDRNCPPNVQMFEELKEWSRICKNLYFWDYYFGAGHVLLPYPDLFMFKPNINTLLDHGVKGIFMQTEYAVPTTDLIDLRHYLMTRLVWNPMLNDREVVDEFLDLHYVESAPPIRRFINLVHDSYRDIELHHVKWQPHALSVDESVAATGLNLFAEAMKLARSDQVRFRVEKASISAYRAVLDPIFKLKGDAEVASDVAEQLRPVAKEYFRLCKRHGIGPDVTGISYGYSDPTRQRFKVIMGSPQAEHEQD